MEDYNELLTQYAMNNENYLGWRKVHTKMFGEIFSSAFMDNTEAQIHLTSALNNISQRDFNKAMTKLDILEQICISDYDTAVVNYFIGLNHELLGNECKMNEYYENLRSSNVPLSFPLALHPYYRTAKLAQKDSECIRAAYYYQKAISLYDGVVLCPQMRLSISQILSDVAAIFLYMHEYRECEKYLKLSYKYDSADNQSRTYTIAVLYAIQGEINAVKEQLENLTWFQRDNCESVVKAILSKTDPHYYIVPQSRSKHDEFWDYLVLRKINIEELDCDDKLLETQNIISEKLTKTLSFMKRHIDCRIEFSEKIVNVYCKHYFAKTLIAEYEALFLSKPKEFSNWNFISVNGFENYYS